MKMDLKEFLMWGVDGILPSQDKDECQVTAYLVPR